jgi:hypothetical protein
MDGLINSWGPNTPLPMHRAYRWFDKWSKFTDEGYRDKPTPEALQVIRDRLEVIIERFHIKAENPRELTNSLNGILNRYNGLIYEENGIIMEIDLFDTISTDDDSIDPYFFGIGNTPIFNKYLYDYYPEILI